MIARSADAVTVVGAVAVLLPGLGSAVVLATDAVLVRDVAWAGAVTTITIDGAAAEAATAGRVQVTETLPVLVHAQPVPAADTNVTPAGSVSVTVMPVASEGPRLVTVTAYVIAPPATTVAVPVLAIARSAEATTVVPTVELLLPGTGSGVVLVTVAALVSDAPCTGARTVTVMAGAEVAVARAGRVQVTETLPALEHAHPVPAADKNVTPTGSVSVTVRDAASEGPALATASE